MAAPSYAELLARLEEIFARREEALQEARLEVAAAFDRAADEAEQAVEAVRKAVR